MVGDGGRREWAAVLLSHENGGNGLGETRAGIRDTAPCAAEYSTQSKAISDEQELEGRPRLAAENGGLRD